MPDVLLQVDAGSLAAALGVAGTAVGGGLVGAARLLVGYLSRRDEQHATLFEAQITGYRASVDDFKRVVDSGREESRETLGALGEIRTALALLNDRVSRIDNHRAP